MQNDRNDVISRQAAIDALNEEYHGMISDESMKIYKIVEWLDGFPSAQQWIPCEERLPEKKGEYLVTYHPCYWDIVEPEIKVGIDSFLGKTSWAKRKYQRVIAWMELPEAAKLEG